MNTLVVDTSTPYLIVGVDKSGVVFKTQERVDKKHSESLIKTVDSVLDQAGLKISDVNRIVVANGPGSYTGVRIAVTFVKTLALVFPNLEVYTVNTLLGFVGLEDGFVLLDARSGRVFGAHASQGVLKDVAVYQVDELNEDRYFGDVHLLSLPDQDFDGVVNYLSVEKAWEKVDDVDTLVPMYLK